jgi:hypothetical protein
MRLPQSLIEIMGRRIVRSLLDGEVIASDHPDRTAEKVARLIARDLQVEDALTEEVRTLLLDHHQAVLQGDVEMHRLHAKMKAELAHRRGYVLSSGPGRLSREKILDLTLQIRTLLLEDADVEYFVKAEDLRSHIQRAFEREMGRDADRERKAREKVLGIKRRIPEGSPEYQALFQQFYRELLEKEG